ncbi:DUF3017 domain-containing protein [Phycicoccus sp. 3266]|uniref:DUF3017 domain-containing protein n=1 Tax=Phycicoccus sp. 3266 TaxID=2817751 RepID=UPI002863BF91|nr:DUF3017 domain-containing protein [Phycicoccus sp. 3266]MDR6862401.1 hypothetical protein [Phycicoccus sp. 3266]
MTPPKLGWWWVATPVLLLGLYAFTRGEVRLAGYVMAAGVGLAAVLRLVLPAGRGGGLAVRSRFVDVATLVLLALGLAVITHVLDLRPRG